MEESFRDFVGNSKSILILLPIKPTFDQVASGLSLYLVLRSEKDVQVYSPSPMIVEFNRIIGINKISGELGNKNLIIEFADYKATDIERVSYDIKDSQFKLTVIPKQTISPPSKENVVLSYSGVNSDAVIMIGGLNESHFPVISNRELVGVKTAHIGIRNITLSSDKDHTSFVRPISSVSEVVASLIKESGIGLDEDAATNLIMGIENATNFFVEPSVSAETFMTISELMKKGGKRSVRPQTNQYLERPVPGIFSPARRNDKTVFGNIPQTPKSGSGEESKPSDWFEPKIYKGGGSVS